MGNGKCSGNYEIEYMLEIHQNRINDKTKSREKEQLLARHWEFNKSERERNGM